MTKGLNFLANPRPWRKRKAKVGLAPNRAMTWLPGVHSVQGEKLIVVFVIEPRALEGH